jgi:hypothetical protein
MDESDNGEEMNLMEYVSNNGEKMGELKREWVGSEIFAEK